MWPFFSDRFPVCFYLVRSTRSVQFVAVGSNKSPVLFCAYSTLDSIRWWEKFFSQKTEKRSFSCHTTYFFFNWEVNVSILPQTSTGFAFNNLQKNVIWDKTNFFQWVGFWTRYIFYVLSVYIMQCRIVCVLEPHLQNFLQWIHSSDELYQFHQY